LCPTKFVSKNVVKNIVPVTTVSCWTSTQIRKPIDHYGFTTVEKSGIEIRQTFIAFITIAGEPQNYAQILQSPN